MSSVSLHARRFDVPDSFQAIQDYCWEQGWTDGLPVVPPTEPLVREMLAGYDGNPSGEEPPGDDRPDPSGPSVV